MRAVLAVIVAGLLLAGCSGSSGAGSPTSRLATASPGASSGTGSPAAASSGAPGQAAPDKVVRAVRSAYAVFFSGRSTWQQSQASLQNGARFHATLVAQGKSQYASTSSARVRSVRLLSPRVASVTYDILSGGQALLQNVHGHAVHQGSRWLVAAETFCGLLRLEGDAPHACSDPAVTALPS
jgi:hypothetical protein